MDKNILEMVGVLGYEAGQQSQEAKPERKIYGRAWERENVIVVDVSKIAFTPDEVTRFADLLYTLAGNVRDRMDAPK